MTNNTIDDAALEQVSGGVNLGGYQFSGQVNPENWKIGQSYYITNGVGWFYGELVEIRQDSGHPTYHFNITRQQEGKFPITHLNTCAEAIKVYTTIMANC